MGDKDVPWLQQTGTTEQVPDMRVFANELLGPAAGLVLHDLPSFRPVAYEALGMNMVQVCTRDVSAVSCWHGRILLETDHDHCSLGAPMVGFSITCLQDLQKKRQTRWVPQLLWRALLLDLATSRTIGRVPPKITIVSLYARALLLVLINPRTMRIR